MEKVQRKETIYDKMTLNESTLAIFIIFGILLTALAMGLGYFKGNNGGAAVPAGVENREKSDTEVFAEEDGKQKPENETENFDNVKE